MTHPPSPQTDAEIVAILAKNHQVYLDINTLPYKYVTVSALDDRKDVIVVGAGDTLTEALCMALLKMDLESRLRQLEAALKVVRAARNFMEEVTEDCPTLDKVRWKELDKALAPFTNEAMSIEETDG